MKLFFLSKKLVSLTLVIFAFLPFNSQVISEQQEKEISDILKKEFELRSKNNSDSYIVGPGDGFSIDIDNIPEFCGNYFVKKDGTINLPRIKDLYVEGLTINELNLFLTNKYKDFLLDPIIDTKIIRYRGVDVYVGGEIARPGFYTLTGLTDNASFTQCEERYTLKSNNQIPKIRRSQQRSNNKEYGTYIGFKPTVFDAIREAGGITPFSNISDIEISRKNSISDGGGRKKTTISLVELITNGDQSQNIQLLDGDTVFISKTNLKIKDQLLQTGLDNLNPEFITVFVSGRINLPGATKVPTGASLNQAISIAGGTKILKGNIEFLRFQNNGEIDRRVLSYNPKDDIGSIKNPILMNGDIIRIKNSPLTTTLDVTTEITGPIPGIYALIRLFKD